MTVIITFSAAVPQGRLPEVGKDAVDRLIYVIVALTIAEIVSKC